MLHRLILKVPIFSFLLLGLMRISPLKSEADSKKLRAMLHEIDSSVHGMQTMKASSKYYEGLLVSVLLNDKFPDDIKLLTGRKLETDKLDWTLDSRYLEVR